MIKFQFDINKLQRDIEQIKKKIIQGIHDGQIDAQDFMEGIMKIYIDLAVYQKYNPTLYERTYDLLNNVTSKVEGTTLYVYVDDTGMDKTQDGVTYPYRVLEGHNVHPYEFPVPGAGFMGPRDWVTMTKDEFLAHAQQNNWYKDILVQAIQKRL